MKFLLVFLACLTAVAQDARLPISSAGTFTNTNDSVLKITGNSLDPQTERLAASNVPGGTMDMVSAGLAIPALSTSLEGKAIFGAITNASTTTGGIAGQFFARASGSGSGNPIAGRIKLWGVNALLEDGSPLGTYPYVGFDWVYLTNEWDYNVFNSKTQVVGHSIGGVWSAQPQSSLGYVVNGTGGPFKWDAGLVCLAGAAATCLSVGPSAAGYNSGSQPMSFVSVTPTGQARTVELFSDAYGNFILRPKTADSVFAVQNQAATKNVFAVNTAISEVVFNGTLRSVGTTLAQLGMPGNGVMIYCADCVAQSNPCVGSGAGAIAKRLAGAWDCR